MGSQVLAITMMKEEEWRLFCIQTQPSSLPGFRLAFPSVWAEDNQPGLTQNRAAIIIELIPGTQPKRQRQCTLPQKAKMASKNIWPKPKKESRYPSQMPVSLEYATLSVKKPGGGYRPVYNLRAINKVTISLYPVVPNPYTLLS